MFRLEEIADELRERGRDARPREYSQASTPRGSPRPQRRRERLCAALKVLFARRAVDGNGWRNGNDAIVPEQWFARLSGCSESEARRALKMGERLADLPATEKKLRDGSLSLAQASICAEGAAADPGAEAHLLRIADKGEMRRLREVKERVVTAAMDETEARRRAHRDRNLRTWTQGLSTHGSFQGPTEEVAVLLAAIEPLKRQAFTAARKADEHDTPDAYRYDALIELGRRAMHVGVTPRPPTQCRSPGCGSASGGSSTTRPPPARRSVRSPASDPSPSPTPARSCPTGSWSSSSPTASTSRPWCREPATSPKPSRSRSKNATPTCNVRGCDRTDELERHHLEGGFAEHHLTTYKLLGNACPHHHDLITHDHYDVIINDDGSWTLRPPDEQRDTDAA